MEIISVMMTLIIFLFIISFLIVLSLIYKIKAKARINVDGGKIDVAFEIMNKKYNKSKELNIWNSFLEKFLKQEGAKDIDVSENQVDTLIKEIHDVASLVDVETLNASFILGTPFVVSTILSNVVASTLIPIVYQKLFNGSGKLIYEVIPDYNNFRIEGNIEISFFITSFQILLVYIWLKKKNNKYKKGGK